MQDIKDGMADISNSFSGKLAGWRVSEAKGKYSIMITTTYKTRGSAKSSKNEAEQKSTVTGKYENIRDAMMIIRVVAALLLVQSRFTTSSR